MNRLLPIIGASLLTLVLGGAGGWFYGNLTAPKTVVVAEQKPEFAEHPPESRIVNLADQGGRRYLKLTMVLKTQEKAGAAHVESLPNLPQVHDTITAVLTAKRSTEVVQSSGRERLKEELREALNHVLPGDHRVAAVYFTDFILQ